MVMHSTPSKDFKIRYPDLSQKQKTVISNGELIQIQNFIMPSQSNYNYMNQNEPIIINLQTKLSTRKYMPESNRKRRQMSMHPMNGSSFNNLNKWKQNLESKTPGKRPKSRVS